MQLLSPPDPVHTATSLPRWRELGWLPDQELGRQDVASVNLAVAQGLPGSDRIDPGCCLRTLDAWADHVRSYTARTLPKFRQAPERYQHSEAYFRVLILITVLQRDLGVRYNPAKVPEDAPFDLADTYIHGVIQGPGGTCATLPVVYAAVGQRLGYPIKLVAVKAGPQASHQFARWEGDGERFNIEASARGLSCPPDDYYRTGRYEMTPELERQGCFLVSKTPRMELAGFVYERAIIWEEAGHMRRCVEGYAWASALAPDNFLYRNTLKLKLNDWTRWAAAQKPRGFPARVQITPPSRRLFPETLPVEFERDMLGLMAVENMLLDPQWSPNWERMRRGEWQGRTPDEALVAYAPDGSCDIRLRFESTCNL